MQWLYLQLPLQLCFGHEERIVHKVSDDLIDIPPVEPNLCELSCFHLPKKTGTSATLTYPKHTTARTTLPTRPLRRRFAQNSPVIML